MLCFVRSLLFLDVIVDVVSRNGRYFSDDVVRIFMCLFGERHEDKQHWEVGAHQRIRSHQNGVPFKDRYTAWMASFRPVLCLVVIGWHATISQCCPSSRHVPFRYLFMCTILCAIISR